ncbi:apolipoprotein N-acyltransferase [candidate division KSB1 bacterium]
MRLRLIKFSKQDLQIYGTALIAGVIPSFAFPPFPLGFIAYFALVPILFWVRKGSLSYQFKLGYVWGFGFQTALLFWLVNSHIGAAVLTFLYVPLYTGTVFLICRFLYIKFGKSFYFLFPFIWTTAEYLRSIGVLAFSWMSFAYTQTYYLPLIQFSDITGMFGVTFFICVINVVLFKLIVKIREFKSKPVAARTGFTGIALPAVILLALFIVPYIYGIDKQDYGEAGSNRIKVSLMQGHIDMDRKTDDAFYDSNFKIYEDLTEKAVEEYSPDLIIWPETATAIWMRGRIKYINRMKRLLRKVKTPLLTGSPDVEIIYDPEGNKYKQFNSSVFYEDHRSNGEWYAKIILVPFGEWFPYEDRFPLFQKLDLGISNFTPGNDYKIFTLNPNTTGSSEMGTAENSSLVKPVKFSIGICYESIFPGFIRKFCKLGSQMLFVISNDNWFGKTTALYQHSQFAVYRAIENRIGVANCSNSGISSIIDPYGRVTAESNIWMREFLNGEVFYRDDAEDMTFYTEHGDIFFHIITVMSFVFIITGFVIKKEQAEN